MKRDTELVRKILLAVEGPGLSGRNPRIEGYDTKLTRGHIRMLVEGGFLTPFEPPEEQLLRTLGRKPVDPELTWEGRNLLESMRNKSTWNAARETLLTLFKELAFYVLRRVLI